MTPQHQILPLEGVGTTNGNGEHTRGDEAAHHSGAAPAPVVLGPSTPTDQVLEHWKAIQGKFVDDPHGSVADARALVDDLIQHIVRGFTEQRESLDRQWSGEAAVSTEQLRLCLQQYRALFAQLSPVVPTLNAADTSPQR